MNIGGLIVTQIGRVETRVESGVNGGHVHGDPGPEEVLLADMPAALSIIMPVERV